MFYGILILLLVLALAGYIYEKREGMAALRAAKRYKSELEEERRWSDKMCKERNDAIKKCIELEKAQIDYALRNWDKATTDIAGQILYREGDITLIYENGLLSWCKSDNVPITFKNVPDETENSAV